MMEVRYGSSWTSCSDCSNAFLQASLSASPILASKNSTLLVRRARSRWSIQMYSLAAPSTVAFPCFVSLGIPSIRPVTGEGVSSAWVVGVDVWLQRRAGEDWSVKGEPEEKGEGVGEKNNAQEHPKHWY